MTIGIIVPVILLAIVVPVGLAWAKKSFKESADGSDEQRPTGITEAFLARHGFSR